MQMLLQKWGTKRIIILVNLEQTDLGFPISQEVFKGSGTLEPAFDPELHLA